MSRPLLAATLVGALALAGCAGGNANVVATPIALEAVYDVNDAGVVVGSAGEGIEASKQAWMIDLTTGERRQLEVPAYEWVEVSHLAVNGTGVAVGTVSGSPLRWRLDSGAVEPLETPGGSGGAAADVNDAGLVVGHTGTYVGQATVWGPGSNQHRVLPGLGGKSRAYRVNDHGLAVGVSSLDEQPYDYDHAVSWDVAAGTVRRLEEPPSALWSEALAVNNTGDIVGIVGFEGGVWSTQMARWDATTGKVRLIGPRGSWGDGVVRPVAVNDRGMVAGDKGKATFNPGGLGLDPHAVRLDLSTGATIDLAPKTSYAKGIDSQGRVVGWRWDEGQRVAMKWSIKP